MAFNPEQKETIRNLEKILRNVEKVNLEILDKAISRYYAIFPEEMRMTIIDTSLWYVQELANLYPKIGSDLTEDGNMMYLSYMTINIANGNRAERVYRPPPSTYTEAALKSADLLMQHYSADCDEVL